MNRRDLLRGLLGTLALAAAPNLAKAQENPPSSDTKSTPRQWYDPTPLDPYYELTEEEATHRLEKVLEAAQSDQIVFWPDSRASILSGMTGGLKALRDEIMRVIPEARLKAFMRQVYDEKNIEFDESAMTHENIATYLAAIFYSRIETNGSNGTALSTTDPDFREVSGIIVYPDLLDVVKPKVDYYAGNPDPANIIFKNNEFDPKELINLIIAHELGHIVFQTKFNTSKDDKTWSEAGSDWVIRHPKARELLEYSDATIDKFMEARTLNSWFRGENHILYKSQNISSSGNPDGTLTPGDRDFDEHASAVFMDDAAPPRGVHISFMRRQLAYARSVVQFYLGHAIAVQSHMEGDSDRKLIDRNNIYDSLFHVGFNEVNDEERTVVTVADYMQEASAEKRFDWAVRVGWMNTDDDFTNAWVMVRYLNKKGVFKNIGPYAQEFANDFLEAVDNRIDMTQTLISYGQINEGYTAEEYYQAQKQALDTIELPPLPENPLRQRISFSMPLRTQPQPEVPAPQ